MSRLPLAGLLGAALAALAAAPAGAERLPPEGRCPALSAAPGAAPGEDAMPLQLREGMVLGYQDLLALSRLLPPEIWRNRLQFFHDGMRMEIGPCHRRYPAGAAYAAATERFAGQARVDDDGNLHDYTAGRPFDGEATHPESEDAGVRWAWNAEMRWRGAGPVGRFRLVDMPSRLGSVHTYEGTFFLIQTRHRADLAGSDYRLPQAEDDLWVAGGRFQEPFEARHLAWRQFRPAEVQHDWSEPDDTFVYVPTMRKLRRAATSWSDGVFTPRYTVSGDAGGGGMAIGGGNEFGVDAINPTAGRSIAASEDIRRGFTGLALRPNAWIWRVQAEREVLAPLNGSRPGYPESERRNFGESGLSFGNDRWEVRYAVVLEAVARRGDLPYDRLELWVDFQTGQPLYWMTRRGPGRLVDVGLFVHRFSGDIPAYPTWPDGSAANVFDPVGAAFYQVAAGNAGWRRESYDVRSVPVEGAELQRFTSSDALLKGGR